MSTEPNDDRSVVISAVERERRQRAANFARASVGLEGFMLTEADEERARRFIDGEIDLPEFVKAPPIDPIPNEEPL